jgi:hypothetical protein
MGVFRHCLIACCHAITVSDYIVNCSREVPLCVVGPGAGGTGSPRHVSCSFCCEPENGASPERVQGGTSCGVVAVCVVVSA